ncbi:unnamed protein product [Rhizoctonia solani]|nr:unnamed protein product [Rhizoctonia solani]
MDVDQSLLHHFDDSVQHDKENTTPNATPHILAPLSPVAMANVLSPAVLNRGPDSSFQPHKATLMDMSIDEEKLAVMIRAERKMSNFGGGVRRESFPGKHLHTPDASFNCESVVEDVSIGDKSYSSDVTHDEGMSFVYNARSSTPVSANVIPLPPTAQKTTSDPGIVVERPSNTLPESESKASLSIPTLVLEGLGSSSTATSPQTTHSRSPLAFEVDRDTEGKDKLPSCEAEFIPPQRKNPPERAQLQNGLIPPVTGLKSISARAAALRFILPEDSLMEMDSILDVQFPGGMEDEFTAAFARLALGPNSKPQVTKPHLTTPKSSEASQEPESMNSGQQGPPTTIKRNLKGEVGSTESHLAPHVANRSYLEDEHTLNLASLGLNGVGNTLLLDMSLDQLRSKPSEVEHGNATFGGSSFAIMDSSAAEWSTKPMLEAQTPKRTASNSLPDVEDSEMNVEATVKKARPANVRVVSDAVVDALRSGRALHRATNSVSSISDTRFTNAIDGIDERPIGKQVWPRSTASLRRTGSFASYSHTTAEPRQYPGSAVPIQRTRSTMSLRRTSSAISYQPDFMRPHSRTSVADLDSDDDQPYTPPLPTVSRGSSRRSSVYALPEPNDYPASYFERPGSVASIYDRPTSAASVRPTSAASIRPPSAASIRTSSTRPTSAASSLQSGSVISARRASGAYVQPSPAEDELVKGMEGLMRGGMSKIPSTAHSAQESQNVRSTKVAGVEGSATQDYRGAPRSGIRPLSGLSAPRAAGMNPGLGSLKTPGSKIVIGAPGSKQAIGPSTRPTAAGTGSAAKTMSAASGRSVPKLAGLGTRSTASTLRSQSSTQSATVRLRASTLGLFAPDGGPGAGQEPKRLTHKASASSISATPSTTRSLRPPASTSSIRTLGARGTNTTTGSTRSAATAGSIASLREAMKFKETPKR